MRLLVDEVAATYITSIAVYQDTRRYYQTEAGALIVCRNGLDLPGLKGYVVDANAGWDTAQAGFVLGDAGVGRRRTKITVYRRLRDAQYQRRLSEVVKGVPALREQQMETLQDLHGQDGGIPSVLRHGDRREGEKGTDVE